VLLTMRRGRKGLSKSSRNGQRGGENEWGSCLWPEPTLPQKAREGWGNPVTNLGSEKDGPAPIQDLCLASKGAKGGPPAKYCGMISPFIRSRGGQTIP